MTEQFETVGRAESITPLEALARGVQLGLLDPLNISRFHNPEISDTGPSAGVIIPALRRASDFSPGDLLWFYEPPLHQIAITIQFLGIEPRTDLLYCESPDTRLKLYISDPTYFGLWRIRDIEQITNMIKSHPGTGYISPMYYINTIQEAADPATPHDFIKKTTRKITEIARPRRKP